MSRHNGSRLAPTVRVHTDAGRRLELHTQRHDKSRTEEFLYAASIVALAVSIVIALLVSR